MHVTDRTLVPMLLEAWDDLDRAYAEMTEEEATARPDGGSAFGWTLYHLAMFPDLIVSVVLGGGEPHPTFVRAREEHGFSGDCGDWPAIAEAAREVRAKVETALEGMTDADLAETVVPGWGDFPSTTLRYLVLRMVAHMYYHIGEVATRRGRGDDYPGPLTRVLEGPDIEQGG